MLDTDILSEILRARNPAVARNLAAYRATFKVLNFSVVSLMEVVRGLHRQGASNKVGVFLKGLGTYKILQLDPRAAELSGRIYADLERIGQPIGWPDTMIAAIAIRHRIELVTGNTGHYERVVRLGHPLVIANWRV